MNSVRPSVAQQNFWGIKLISDERIIEIKKKFLEGEESHKQKALLRAPIDAKIKKANEYVWQKIERVYKTKDLGIHLSKDTLKLREYSGLTVDEQADKIIGILQSNSDVFGSEAGTIDRDSLRKYLEAEENDTKLWKEFENLQGYTAPGKIVSPYDSDYQEKLNSGLLEEPLPKNHFIVEVEKYWPSDYQATSDVDILSLLEKFGINVSKLKKTGVDAVTDKGTRKKMVFDLLKPLIENSDGLPYIAKDAFRWAVASYLFEAGTKMLPLNPAKMIASEFLIEIDKKLGLITPKGNAKTGFELAAKLRPFFTGNLEKLDSAGEVLGERDSFVLTELMLRGGPAIIVGIEEFRRKLAERDISSMTGVDLIRFLYNTHAIKYVQGSEVPDAAMKENLVKETFTLKRIDAAMLGVDVLEKINRSIGSGYFIKLTPQENNTASVEIKVPAVIGNEGFIAKGSVSFNDPEVAKRFDRIIYDISQFGEGYGGPEASIRTSLRELGTTFTDRQVTESAKIRTIDQVRSDLQYELPDYNSFTLIEKKGGKATAQEFLDTLKAAVEEARQKVFAKSNEYYTYTDTLNRYKDEDAIKLLAIRFFYNDNGYPMSPSAGRLQKKFALMEEFYKMRGDKAMRGSLEVTVSQFNTKDIPVGGIDLNAANLNLQIKRDGKGVPLPISQQNLENIKIDGLIPIIIDIKPFIAVQILSK